MTKIATRHSLALIKALGGLTFRPMNDSDFATFADAAPDAQIAFGGEDMASVLCDITGESILTEGGDAVAIIISEGTIEICGMDCEYSPVSIALTLDHLI